jgi:hypothetical protein
MCHAHAFYSSQPILTQFLFSVTAKIFAEFVLKMACQDLTYAQTEKNFATGKPDCN